MSDPFDALRLPAERVDPDPAFAGGLRRRLAEALDLDPSGLPVVDLPQRRRTTMPPTTNDPSVDADSRPTAGRLASTIVPYICVHDARAALAWYGEVFDAVETVRYEGDDGRIGHAEVTIAGAALMLSDEYPDFGAVSPRTIGGTTTALYLTVPDVDDVHDRAVDAGATSLRPPEDQPYGDRSCTLLDPFGHRWMVQTPIASPTLDEVNEAIEGFTASAPPTADDDD